MKQFVIILFTFILAMNVQLKAQNSNDIKKEKIGIVIYSNDPETVWSAFRLANYSQSQGDTISIFLLGKGVEALTIASTQFDIKQLMDDFSNAGGKILACGTCLKSRNMNGTKNCPVSSLDELYGIIKTCKKVLTF